MNTDHEDYLDTSVSDSSGDEIDKLMSNWREGAKKIKRLWHLDPFVYLGEGREEIQRLMQKPHKLLHDFTHDTITLNAEVYRAVRFWLIKAFDRRDRRLTVYTLQMAKLQSFNKDSTRPVVEQWWNYSGICSWTRRLPYEFGTLWEILLSPNQPSEELFGVVMDRIFS
jgi:hypothetical protein